MRNQPVVNHISPRSSESLVGVVMAVPIMYKVAGAMAKKEAFSTGTVDTSAHAEQGDPSGNSPWPKPEEGLRLMHAFFDIKQGEVREAIIGYVEEQSRLQKDR